MILSHDHSFPDDFNSNDWHAADRRRGRTGKWFLAFVARGSMILHLSHHSHPQSSSFVVVVVVVVIECLIHLRIVAGCVLDGDEGSTHHFPNRRLRRCRRRRHRCRHCCRYWCRLDVLARPMNAKAVLNDVVQAAARNSTTSFLI